MDVPGSFETIGHIAHFNLRSGHLPYKHLIGQVCLDKNPSIKTVVTKMKEIENQFRVFDMEVIAGLPRIFSTWPNMHCRLFLHEQGGMVQLTDMSFAVGFDLHKTALAIQPHGDFQWIQFHVVA